MYTNPLISVIIPSYNRASVLPKCVESVLSQSYDNIELLLVDDGSTDDTAAFAAGIKDPRFRYIPCDKNKGACHARNVGGDLSRGELIAFQDSDDIWHCDKLEKQLAFFYETHADMVFCGMNRISRSGSSFYYPVHKFTGKSPVEEMLTENRASTQTMLMKREVWSSLRFDESFRRYQDWDFSIRAAANFNLAYQPVALVDSTVNVDSISALVPSVSALEYLYAKHSALFSAYPRADATMHRRMGKHLKKHDPALAAKHFRTALRTCGSLYDIHNLIPCQLRALLSKPASEETP